MPKDMILPVESWIKFTSTTVGRDKLYRTVQYLSKFLSYYMLKRGTYDKNTIERIARLGVSVGIARKLFRIGKPLDFVQTILKSQSIEDDVIRTCAMGRSLMLAGWLTLDGVQWLNIQKILSIDDIDWVNRNAARFWFFGLLFALSADLYRLRNNVQRLDAIEKGGFKRLVGEQDLKTEHYALVKEQKKILLEVTQDALDMVIPASILGYINVSSGFVGLVGTVTSLIGWRAAWPRK